MDVSVTFLITTLIMNAQSQQVTVDFAWLNRGVCDKTEAQISVNTQPYGASHVYTRLVLCRYTGETLLSAKIHPDRLEIEETFSNIKTTQQPSHPNMFDINIGDLSEQSEIFRIDLTGADPDFHRRNFVYRNTFQEGDLKPRIFHGERQLSLDLSDHQIQTEDPEVTLTLLTGRGLLANINVSTGQQSIQCPRAILCPIVLNSKEGMSTVPLHYNLTYLSQCDFEEDNLILHIQKQASAPGLSVLEISLLAVVGFLVVILVLIIVMKLRKCSCGQPLTNTNSKRSPPTNGRKKYENSQTTAELHELVEISPVKNSPFSEQAQGKC